MKKQVNNKIIIEMVFVLIIMIVVILMIFYSRLVSVHWCVTPLMVVTVHRSMINCDSLLKWKVENYSWTNLLHHLVFIVCKTKRTNGEYHMLRDYHLHPSHMPWLLQVLNLDNKPKITTVVIMMMMLKIIVIKIATMCL